MGRFGRTDPDCRKPQKGKAQKGQKAQKGAERDFFGVIWPKKSVQIAAAQPVVDNGRSVRSMLAMKIIYY